MAVTTSEARRELARLIDQVNIDHVAIEITSNRGSAVLMSKDEYDALMESSYLLSSPANARRLMNALRSVQEKGTLEHER
ncbi:type II toxin-antitoxin system Phd/YefM family antitoxin [Pseudarthrobacter sp. NPDC092439]|uniref:type II toxin-antitoxin system Phd/YefM family antitoxin n=1 Tax=unclassified Pseudarthrobacter TaxID=2647000 RepID=UPI00381E5E57